MIIRLESTKLIQSYWRRSIWRAQMVPLGTPNFPLSPMPAFVKGSLEPYPTKSVRFPGG